MTGHEMGALLLRLGWSANEMARRLNTRTQAIRRWLRDGPPDHIAAWLTACLTDDPDTPPPTTDR